MFERFTERARQVVVLAQDEARSFGHTHIGPEHILLGLVREEQGLAAQVLAEEEVNVQDLRNEVEDYVGEGDPGFGKDQLPWSLKGKKVLEDSLREALSMGHNYIGTEHIFLGLMKEKSVATMILQAYGLDYALVKHLIIQKLTRSKPAEEAVKQSEQESIRLPKFIQIATATELNSIVLYALDSEGRVWKKFGGNPWKRVDERTK